MRSNRTFKMITAAICLALAMVLPFFTGQIPQIGKMLSPMHIPVFLCGFFCGPIYGLVIGFIAPLLRSVTFGMPALMPSAVGMCFELATYGLISGLMYRALPKKNVYIYVSLFTAMIAGRIVWGIARVILLGVGGYEFGWEAFIAGALLNAIPGIILHIVLVPIIVIAVKKAIPALRE
ncbi:MAG: ECF transporter S component [Lachnospiraceae bacterium]|nr:ECF transporter S component [Lachnospiraceae bacterium]